MEWGAEKLCFQTFLRELALFLVPESLIPPTKDAECEVQVKGAEEWEEKERRANLVAEKILFPAFKRQLIATKSLATEKRVVQIANLPDLYKTFESKSPDGCLEIFSIS